MCIAWFYMCMWVLMHLLEHACGGPWLCICVYAWFYMCVQVLMHLLECAYVCVYAHAPVWACMGGRRLLLGIVLLHFPTFVRLSRSNSGLTDMVSLGSQLVLGVPPLYPLTGQPPHAPGVLCGFLGTQSLVRKLAWPMFRLLSHLPRTMQSGTFTGNNFTI